MENYEKLGLRVGFEIHQELDTHKLFCNCPSVLHDVEPPLKVKRRLRPTQSELGEVDRAALAEALKSKEFRYQICPDSVCLVELDEEPPHPVNDEALDIALEAALLLNAKPIGEVHTMRKIVIDGSNTCGFQRTILVSTDGHAEVNGKRFRIPTICLEEDAARKIREDAENIDYRLDRQGIPLVEIATGPDFSDLYIPAKAALYIGQLLRATGKVKRGIGTIRQDINISITAGARQEVKGVQELALISTVIEREVQRQLALLAIRDELRKREAAKVKKKFVDVNKAFSKTGSRVIRGALEARGTVLAVKLPKFARLLGKELQPGRRFGTELADYGKLYGKVGGLFHTDELPAYGISQEEVDGLKRTTGAAEADAVVFIADAKDKAEAALSAVVDRANQALDGVPEETRRALPDGNTEFMRPLPGAGRMYPETDIPPIVISQERIRKIKKRLPELPKQKIKRFIRDYGLSEELASRISISENASLFEELVKETKADPTLIASTLEETLVNLRREGAPTENIQKRSLNELFVLVSRGKMIKEAIREVLRKIAAEPQINVGDALRSLGLVPVPKSKLKMVILKVMSENKKLVEKRGEDSFGVLMGIVMKEVHGKADGQLVSKLLRKELKRHLSK